ncbi:hypothetical protein L6E12_14290 [Actinokineospora sp. PR83]|uniref:hypothetical protein n=1 Tax=Actinokineospora sp. PR83 TaxID=2884908 RepID=UPI001F237E55|nr:hypothetical protein [Actinokineospora sp. PR83]MCG8916959.1 hypothetical protein [Actinokineospora sp. PR83]
MTEILPRLRSEPADSFRFRKESTAPAGLIPWKAGEELISAARGTLVAGAKSYLDPLRRYSNKHGQFASRYLDGVFMGQTAVGSYIVTALAPTQTPVNLSNSHTDAPVIPGLEVVQARSVTRSISQALEASAEALDHYRKTGSFSGFEAGVQRGVSYDLSVALKGVTEQSAGGDITLEWDPIDIPAGTSDRFTFEFHHNDYKVFDEVAAKLAEDTHAPVAVQILGRVHLLTKKNRGGPGVFGMETVETPTRKYRVRLSDPEQYHLAVNAHDEDLGLTVTGLQERDGNITWLYNARIIRTVAIDTIPALQVQNEQ